MYFDTPVPKIIPDKHLIEQRFSKAAPTYEEQAGVQQVVAEKLLSMLDAAMDAQPLSILEIGCCTGLLTAKLAHRFQEVQRFTAIDLSSSFAPYIQEKTKSLTADVQFQAGDIESIAITEKYDLIVSSSTFHWMHDLPALLAKLSKALTPDGVLAFSIYGDQNLKEIRELTGVGLQYESYEAVLGHTSSFYTVIGADQSCEILGFENPCAILQHLRQTGVNAIGTKSWTRKQLAQFCRQYKEQYAIPEGVQLTYHPMYFIGRPNTAL